jgi:Uncharacterized protein with SCP/PR1 domains
MLLLFTFFLYLVYTLDAKIDNTAVLDEMNKVRTDPIGYADTLEENYLNFERYRWVTPAGTWITSEGAAGVREAIEVLRGTTPMGKLKEEVGLDVTAQVQANFLIGNGTTFRDDPYLGCDGLDVGSRVAEVGKWSKIGESIIGGPTDPQLIVANLLISDGDTYRRHRSNLLNPVYTQVGFGYSNHPRQSNLFVIHYADGFVCDHEVCPLVPDEVPYNCTGKPFEFYGPHLKLSLLLLLAVLAFLYMN